ncbi:dynein gamma flagellar outer arm-like, partial [Brachionus plicatilis]
DILSVSSTSLSEKPKSGAAFQSGSESPSYYRGTAKENGLQLSELEISEIYSADGEVLVLARKVNLEKGTELWLPKLKESIGETIKKYMSVSLMDLLNNMPIEELTLKYPAQICLIGLNYVWSKEVETSILELKNERKAMSMASKKFSAITNRFLSMLSKSRWPNIDKPVLVHHKLRLETMVT